MSLQTEPFYVAQRAIKLSTLLPQPPEGWAYRCEPPCFPPPQPYRAVPLKKLEKDEGVSSREMVTLAGGQCVTCGNRHQVSEPCIVPQHKCTVLL